MIILPSLEIVPAKYNGNILLSQIPIDGSGDFTVSRSLNTATRVNALGEIEVVNANTPRIDYFQSDGTVGCPALLVEPSASNGILNSTDITTNWTLGANLSGTAIDVIGVSGKNITVAVSGSSIGDGSLGALLRASNNVSLASGSTYTISFFLKKTGTHTIGGYAATIAGAAAGDLGGGFDVSGSFNSGVIYDSAGTTNRIRRVEQWGTDVYRCSETFTMTANGTLTFFLLGPTVSVSSATNPAVGLGIGFAAPQIELGSVATSFIPTTTAAFTRNADTISVTGVSGSIGQTEGTVYMEVAVLAVDKELFSISSGGVNGEAIRIQTNSDGRLGAIALVSNSQVITTASINALNLGQFYKVAFAYKLNDYTLYINGVVQTLTDITGGVPVNMNKLVFARPNDSFIQNQRVRAAALYTTRLTNDQLQALTS